jgi:retrograde regulation protein 2
MPAIYADRAAISLFDSQWEGTKKVPIPDNVTKSVVQALKRFQRTCADFLVPSDQIRIIATEATRVALNSVDYREAIKAGTGLEVEMLPKEIEGKTGALGVTSSFESVKGLMMDLGGGSTQITWIVAQNGEMKMSDAGSVSMPYGAAALIKRLEDANTQGHQAISKLRDEITESLREAIKTIAVPHQLLTDAQQQGGMHLYLSGGGFRGWGFLLMSQHKVKPYPIPIINGFSTTIDQFNNISMVTETAKDDDDVFRVSERRSSQVPAVALLIAGLQETLPMMSTVHFAQGGVREGALFLKLTKKQMTEHPIYTATKKYASGSASAMKNILISAIPEVGLKQIQEASQTSTIHHDTSQQPLIQALVQSMYIHNPLNKDIAAAAALRSTTTGVLAAIHGADHQSRALLGIMLCERWGGIGALAPQDAEFYSRLIAILPSETAWWAQYAGRVAAIVAEVYPAGVVDESNVLIAFQPTANDSDGKRNRTLDLNVLTSANFFISDALAKAVKGIEKIGKKKKDKKSGHGLPADDAWKVKVTVSS